MKQKWLECFHFQLSLVDLAGSERVAKTGAGAEQLKVWYKKMHEIELQLTISTFSKKWI